MKRNIKSLLIGIVFLVSYLIVGLFMIIDLESTKLNTDNETNSGALKVTVEIIEPEINNSNNECEYTHDAILKANCLRDELAKFWKYNVSNLDLYWNSNTGSPSKIDWEIIKEQGGVCWHAAEWFVKEAREKGFYADRVWIEIPPLNHSVAVITDDNHNYCILDQTADPLCNTLE